MDSRAIVRGFAPWLIALVVLPACADEPTRSPSDERLRPATRTNVSDSEEERATKRAKVRSGGNDREAKSPAPAVKGPLVHVARVIDGDTIEVHLDGREESVRLVGIDTPETVHPSRPVECFGKAASQFTTDRLASRTVLLEFDVERRDHYGRLLAYVWRDGKLFNHTIVRQGYAQIATYPPNVKYVDRLLSAQRKARTEGAGLWSSCGGESSESTGAATGVQTSSGKCDSNYSGACIPPYPPDLDCGEISTTNFHSTGSDPHGFDGDGDGIACES